MGVTLPVDMVAGAIVGVARLVGVAEWVDEVPEPQRRWWFGPLVWLLADVVAIKPVPCRGEAGAVAAGGGRVREGAPAVRGCI